MEIATGLRLVSFAALALLGCARREAPAAAREVPGASAGRATTTPSSSLATAATSASPAPDAPGFTVVRNLEISPYCLPYPSVMTEDTSERWEHGRRVFVLPKGQARMDFAALCPSETLAALYADDRRGVEAAAPKEAITVSALHATDYVLSWSAGGRIHWMKVWARPNDAGCFVRVHADYVESERARFDRVLPRVSAADPASCPTD